MLTALRAWLAVVIMTRSVSSLTEKLEALKKNTPDGRFSVLILNVIVDALVDPSKSKMVIIALCHKKVG